MTDVLSRRALNRAYLDRQLLLRRAELTPLRAVEHLVGLQAQSPQAPYVGLWTRLQGFRAEELSGHLTDRKVVRIAVMRNTVHLVGADDCLELRSLTQPIFDRGMSNPTYAPGLVGVDLKRLAATAQKLMETRPRTTAELRAELAALWPDNDPAALVFAVRGLLPCVQVPPRGLWRAAGRPTLTTAETWLGRDPRTPPEPDAMVLRYLAAYGPAGVKDAQTWCGLTRLGEVFERLRPRLRVFRDERGTELFDLPDAPRPDPGTAAPVRFLPEYDNLFRSHADRSRIVSDEHRQRLSSRNDAPRPSFCVDGFLRGTWKIDRDGRDTAVLVVEPFQRLSKKHAAALGADGGRLLRFAAPDAGTHDIRIAEVSAHP
ncbi:MAG: winged helix DNA-binding domain-containing protein [Propionibacteriales bacterium]|nr:winged helix DNA-binding domain-containing protein [Propionibacteriales bacterium]